MFNINDAIGWIGNIAVFKSERGYVLVDWPSGNARMEVNHELP